MPFFLGPGASRQHLKKNAVPFLNYIDAEENCDISEQRGNSLIELEAEEAALKELHRIPDDWFISTEVSCLFCT